MPQKGSHHTTMTDKVRIALCQYKKAHPKATQKELMKWLEDNYNVKISQATISTTLKRSEELLAKSDHVNLNAKRQRTVKYPAMEPILLKWFWANQERANMSGDLIRASAIKIVDRLYPGHEPFEFSSGWLESFKVRHGIHLLRRFSMESGSVDMAAVAKALPGIRELLNKYAWRDIYNMDETGLFYRMQADQSLATKQLEGLEHIQERITLVVCCNGDGSDKLPLWVIGKCKNPRCFRNINMSTLMCQYRSNAKAWLSQKIFVEWLKAFDLHVAGRKVLLLLDSSGGSIPPEQLLSDQIRLQNTTLFYFPPETKSKLQPCNAGIVCNLKAYYRRRFNRLLLQHLEENPGNSETVDVLGAIQMAVSAWMSDVKPTTIASCFRHCRIRTPEQLSVENVGPEDDLVDLDVILDLESQIRRFSYHSPMDIQNLLNCPGEVISYTPDINEIIEEHIQEGSSSAPPEDGNEDDSQEVPPVNAADAYKMIETLERFWMQQDDCNMSFITALQEMKDSVDVIRRKQMVQKYVDNFFQHT